MASSPPLPPAREGASYTSSLRNRPSEPALRSRRPGLADRNSSNSPAPHQLPRRRSSMISLGTESVNSFRSTTDDLLLPRVGNSGLHDEPSALHSAPLFLAMVPAAAGMVFQNGSSVMTDVTLLALAAVLLNWSIRLPWEWYHSAQSVRVHDSMNVEDFLPANTSTDTIVEEEGDEDGTGSGDEAAANQQSTKQPATSEQLSAATSLRMHELLALTACFLGPLAGAWLLHTIRSQLSRPSEGLVSNYNLTIFLLASEIRPLSHLIKLIQNRTLHLQKIVAQNPHASPGSSIAGISNDEIAALAARVSNLESGTPTDAATAATTTTRPSSSSPEARDALILEVRRSLQPDIDALNRAVRRYEKRATLLSMQVDSRLSTLETRVQDTLALAAAAERSASGSRKGSARVLLDWLAGMVVMPVQAATWMLGKALELPNRVAALVLRMLVEVAEAVLPAAWVGKIKSGRPRSTVDAKTRVRTREKEKSKVAKKAA